jgi:hypothetical protein
MRTAVCPFQLSTLMSPLLSANPRMIENGVIVPRSLFLITTACIVYSRDIILCTGGLHFYDPIKGEATRAESE